MFLGLDSNRQDAVTEIAAFARDHEVSFPILKDLNQVVADQVGATRTPQVVVLDRGQAIRYRGRIDDQYGIKSNSSFVKAAPTERDLAQALDELLAGKAVSQSETPVTGCLLGRDLHAENRQRSDLQQTNLRGFSTPTASTAIAADRSRRFRSPATRTRPVGRP